MRREYFANQSISIYLNGNPNLCGPKVFLLSTCPTTRGLPTIVERVLLPLIGVVFFILCLFLIFLWRRNKNIDYSRNNSLNVRHQRISYQEIHIATNRFAETNLLGAGNSKSVYKGILRDGTLVAVKVFQLQNDQDKKSFEVECNILKKVRHKNLVRVITSCSDIHFKCLVFGFMSNGSLDKHLYHNRDDNNGEDVSELGLITQLYIAIDVAHAIEYLHHDCFVEIVHCDIKPSNVLLDENMRGYVTDFGIARIICGYTNSHTSSLALRGSIGYIAPGMAFLNITFTFFFSLTILYGLIE
jgi:LRR receptor-like serine/threonine-protein kinase FLS2